MNNRKVTVPITEYALLGFLVAGPCHGYDLHKRMTDESGIGMVWGVKIANMYAQLEKLAARGWITGHFQANEQRPTRLEYSLTPDGAAEFQRWLFQLVEHPREFRFEFMVRAYFLIRYHPDQLEEQVQRQLEICRQWLANTESKESALSQPGSFENLIFHYRSSQIHSTVAWLEWLLIQIPKILSRQGNQ